MASVTPEKKLDMSLDDIIVQERAKTDAGATSAATDKSTNHAEHVAESSSHQAEHGDVVHDVEMESSTAVNCRVYVGNLSWSIKSPDLKEHMETAGSVEAATVLEWNGRSKGCGVVTYESEDAAKNAIATLNDTELGGRKIFVREDRESQSSTAVKPKRGYRVYVGNLSWTVKWQELKDHMKKVGTVVHADVLEEANGRSKGCGLVEYASPEEAATAIAELNNTELEGRLIFVREDREPEGGSISKFAKRAAPPRGGGGGANGGGNGGGGGGSEGRQLYVGNLPWDTNWQQLKDLFATAGVVERADIAEHSDGRSRGFGIIRYTNAADAWQAIERFNGFEIEGRLIEVRLDKRE
uniref:RRM domain-containing protein n=1 Tax=Peronospora matthiolae TaxID=2874970 RepID=A0AAV1UTN4_9STRA